MRHWRYRFWDKVEIIPNKCWKWLAYKDPNGYGRIAKMGSGPTIPAHRASWIIHNGKIKNGLFVLHKCDNPPCTNPRHLFLGTQQDNLNDMRKKGREKTNGKKLNAEIAKRIRRMKNSGKSQEKIGKIFGICQASVSKILLHKVYK